MGGIVGPGGDVTPGDTAEPAVGIGEALVAELDDGVAEVPQATSTAARAMLRTLRIACTIFPHGAVGVRCDVVLLSGVTRLNSRRLVVARPSSTTASPSPGSPPPVTFGTPNPTTADGAEGLAETLVPGRPPLPAPDCA